MLVLLLLVGLDYLARFRLAPVVDEKSRLRSKPVNDRNPPFHQTPDTRPNIWSTVVNFMEHLLVLQFGTRAFR
jgi:hypothetical protein